MPWLCAAIVLAGCTIAPVRGDYVARLEALALLQTLNADLLSHDSATLTLERWCAEHRLAEPPRIVANRLRDTDKPIPDELRTRLGAATDEPVRYRHVQLVCGEHILSEADNWYLPKRLSAEMNQQLDETDAPFGKVVKPLGLERHTLSAELLWQPLSRGWEMQRSDHMGEPQIPHDVLRHRAILFTSAHLPFSAVVETYTNQLFDFAKRREREN